MIRTGERVSHHLNIDAFESLSKIRSERWISESHVFQNKIANPLVFFLKHLYFCANYQFIFSWKSSTLEYSNHNFVDRNLLNSIMFALKKTIQSDNKSNKIHLWFRIHCICTNLASHNWHFVSFLLYWCIKLLCYLNWTQCFIIIIGAPFTYVKYWISCAWTSSNNKSIHLRSD